MDLEDLEHNTRDGLHAASLAGTWIALVPGLAGLRDHDGTLAFAPRLPAGITRLAITLSVRGRRLRVEITPGTTSYRLLDGGPLRLLHDGTPFTVTCTHPVIRPTTATPEPTGGAPTQPRGRAPAHRRPRP
ncbi:glycosyl hydrolase family 65 protein [Arthrobacter livingstonensis]|uniref:glycosyl hydrolase family 65 protein n=1 Tax=Arthrobacter livingstonensis TaxID=670078 RepID=UPI0034D2CFA8